MTYQLVLIQFSGPLWAATAIKYQVTLVLRWNNDALDYSQYLFVGRYILVERRFDSCTLHELVAGTKRATDG